MSADDLRFMRRALALADSRLGHTWPNPTVGCVIVKDGEVVGEGVTGDGGRPHGEEMALAGIGEAAKGATAYVVLEPCAKRSSDTARSCAQRLADAGVARVVIAAEDPHQRGAGPALLRDAGIAVEIGLCREEAEGLNAGFFSRVVNHRPIICANAERARYDAVFNPPPGEALGGVLERLGGAGFTRMCVAPNSPLAETLAKQGLLTPVFKLGA